MGMLVPPTTGALVVAVAAGGVPPGAVPGGVYKWGGEGDAAGGYAADGPAGAAMPAVGKFTGGAADVSPRCAVEAAGASSAVAGTVSVAAPAFSTSEPLEVGAAQFGVREAVAVVAAPVAPSGVTTAPVERPAATVAADVAAAEAAATDPVAAGVIVAGVGEAAIGAGGEEGAVASTAAVGS